MSSVHFHWTYRQYLHVTLEIPKEDTPKVNGYMQELLPVFQGSEEEGGAGWNLHQSFKRDTGDTDTYLNLWTVPNLNSLPQLMSKFADNRAYVDLDMLVTREIQNFMGSLSYNPESADSGFEQTRDAPAYVEEVLDMSKDQKKVIAFNHYMNECIYWKLKSKGWHIEAGLYTQTGLLCRYYHIWAVDDPSTIEEITAEYTASDAYKAVVKSRTQTIWSPADYSK